MLPHMIKLVQHHCPFGMHRISYGPKPGDHRVGRGQEIPPCQHSAGMHRHRLHHDHRRTAARPFAVVTQMPRPRQPAFGHIGGMGAKGDAVAQGLAAQVQRLEQVGKRDHGCLRVPYSLADPRPTAALAPTSDVAAITGAGAATPDIRIGV